MKVNHNTELNRVHRKKPNLHTINKYSLILRTYINLYDSFIEIMEQTAQKNGGAWFLQLTINCTLYYQRKNKINQIGHHRHKNRHTHLLHSIFLLTHILIINGSTNETAHTTNCTTEKNKHDRQTADDIFYCCQSFSYSCFLTTENHRNCKIYTLNNLDFFFFSRGIYDIVFREQATFLFHHVAILT